MELITIYFPDWSYRECYNWLRERPKYIMFRGFTINFDLQYSMEITIE